MIPNEGNTVQSESSTNIQRIQSGSRVQIKSNNTLRYDKIFNK